MYLAHPLGPIPQRLVLMVLSESLRVCPGVGGQSGSSGWPDVGRWPDGGRESGISGWPDVGRWPDGGESGIGGWPDVGSWRDVGGQPDH